MLFILQVSILSEQKGVLRKFQKLGRRRSDQRQRSIGKGRRVQASPRQSHYSEKAHPHQDQIDQGERGRKEYTGKNPRPKHGNHTHGQCIPNKARKEQNDRNRKPREWHQPTLAQSLNQWMEKKNQAATWTWKDSVPAPQNHPETLEQSQR